MPNELPVAIVQMNSQDDTSANVAAAIDVAVASIPPFYVPKIVLLSDGNETAGDAVLAAASAGMPISTVPLAVRSDPEVQVTSVTVPAQVRQGEPRDVSAQRHDGWAHLQA